MNYFKTVGGILILIATIGLETLFGAGIWYMIDVGMQPALGPVWSGLLALIVAPIIGIMAVVMFVSGHRLKQIVLEWEAQHGKQWNEEHEVYFNKPSLTWMVSAIKYIVIAADTGGIAYRVLQEHIPWYGKLLIFFVFEVLAISPWFVGTLVHIVATRPAYAIRREVEYVRDVTGAQDELKEIYARNKKQPRPATARIAGNNQFRPQIDGPKEEALPKYQAEPERAKLNQNGN